MKVTLSRSRAAINRYPAAFGAVPLSLTRGKVSFQWKDYRNKDKQNSKTMTIEADGFIRRFLLYTPPKRFQRIRHFGFLPNAIVSQTDGLPSITDRFHHQPSAQPKRMS